MKWILGKAFSKVFNRFTITGLLIVIQFAWFCIILVKLADYNTSIALFFNVVSIIMALFILWRDDKPVYKNAWLFLVCMLPILGTAMYAMFGNKRPAKSLKSKMDPVEAMHWEDMKAQDEICEDKTGTRLHKTINYIDTMAGYPAWTNTKSKYYSSAELAMMDLIHDIKNAKKFIFMEYFIISEGSLWSEIFEILKEKAREGVDVRIIYDDVGSISTLPRNLVKNARKNNIKILPFNTMKPFVSMVYNNRDHRKITVVDGNVGYSGGFNLADEYVNKIERFGHWKDTGIRLEGRGVWNFTVMFLNMWNAFIPTEEDYTEFRPDEIEPETEYGEKINGIVQPYSDSPLDYEDVGENVYLEILSQAENYVYIFTPYLIIDNEMKTALILAAKRGVDVRLVTPAIPDKKTIFRLTRSYYEPLLKAGVRIYEYTPGFIHAKSYIADDRVAVVGTINMDYRSLFLHFECGTLLIDCDCLKEIKEDCLETMAISREIFYNDCKRTFFGLLFDSVLRAFSPLL